MKLFRVLTVVLAGFVVAAWLSPAGAQPVSPSAVATPARSHKAKKPVAAAAAKHVPLAAAAAKHVPVAAAAAKHVPVVAPRHAGPPRHAPAANKLAKAKRILVRKEPPPAPKVVVRKPPPPAPPADLGTNTGLHLPRYAALKSDDVNMRSGPGERYPIQWQYKRRDLPVKIEREFDIWRLVEDMDGVKGWVHQATLTGRRSFVVMSGADRTLRSDARDTADAVAVLKPGVVGRVKSCEAGKAWCQVQVGDYRGWLQRSDVWGVDADEAVSP